MTVAELIDRLQRVDQSLNAFVVTKDAGEYKLQSISNPVVVPVAKYDGVLMLWQSIPSDIDEHDVPISRESALVVFYAGC